VKISPRDKNFLTAGVIGVIAVAIFYALMSLPNSDELAQKLEQLKDTYNRQTKDLEREPVYRTQIAEYKQRYEKDMAHLLPGDNSTVAGAELLKLLKDFADKDGVNITSRNNLPDKKQGMLTKISARIDTSCDIEQLVRFLSEIENYSKFLKIEELMISSFRMPVQGKYEIRPNLTVAGYILTQEEKPSEKPASKAKTAVR
jgi:Tfp pilus assembly protein PilO